MPLQSRCALPSMLTHRCLCAAPFLQLNPYSNCTRCYPCSSMSEAAFTLKGALRCAAAFVEAQLLL